MLMYVCTCLPSELQKHRYTGAHTGSKGKGWSCVERVGSTPRHRQEPNGFSRPTLCVYRSCLWSAHLPQTICVRVKLTFRHEPCSTLSLCSENISQMSCEKKNEPSKSSSGIPSRDRAGNSTPTVHFSQFSPLLCALLNRQTGSRQTLYHTQ